jgi:hypothetical protein
MTVIDEIAQEISEFESDHGRKPAEMWLTKRDKFDIGKLGRDEFPLAGKVMHQGVEKAVTALFGVPIAAWNSTEREYRMTGTNGGTNAETVRGRVTDWIARLNALFDKLETWAAEVPNARVERDHMPQQIEDSLTRFSVKVREVPTFTAFVDRKNRIAFVPSALWIVGANGRVNVTTNYRQYALLDLAQPGTSSDWQLLVAGAKTHFKPFDQALFLKLISERS